MSSASTDFRIQIIKQGRLFIAYSHTLDLATTGKSEAQAVTRFEDLVQIFLRQVIKNESERVGALGPALVHLGWTKREKRWSPPAEPSTVP